ncbi:MAG TPA: hypothetical protein VN609_08165, partial [Propionibacteriaceae bacterium]|nr:hypothetical protein [Propionibacteriaceae bacterium]
MENHQRRYLLESYEGLVADIREEAASEDTPSAGNRHWIDICDRIIEWLKGGPKPTAEVREFLEERRGIRRLGRLRAPRLRARRTRRRDRGAAVTT